MSGRWNGIRIGQVRCLCVAALVMGASAAGLAPVFAQTGPQAATVKEFQDVLEKLEQAIGDGNAEAVFENASRQIEVSILGDVALYSKAQAQQVVRKFFSEHPPDRFSFSDGSTAEQRRFAEGLYFGKRHKAPYRVFVYLRNADGLWELRELRIEPPAGRD